MGKNALQRRAETLAREFRASHRPALVIEFAGLPKAGKTSTLHHVYHFLRRCGFRCEIVVERASVCPIRDKKHANFNIWTACTTLSALLEKTQNPPSEGDPDILFLDRGIFDSLCWLTLLERLARITPAERQLVDSFLLAEDWTRRISGVVSMTADSGDALSREQGYLPVHGPGGSIMNATVLDQMKVVFGTKAKELKETFRVFPMDTSAPEFREHQDKVCKSVARKILDWVAESVEENILSVPRELLPSQDSFVVTAEGARDLAAKFEKEGNFRPRGGVESDLSRVQPLPIVIVKNRSGHILRLIRKERESANPLNRKAVIWAGGHVRREDGAKGKRALLTGAVRELQEELRIRVEPEDLQIIGAVYATSGENTRKHVAFVYEWQAETDDVEIAICNSEFQEKSGTSLRGGTFLSVEELAEEMEAFEEWSAVVVRQMLLGGSTVLEQVS